ncbi:Major facilitator-type transporter [Fulvia fulva]|uniref:Major facilitator-type transporter n=1 Tax=Passalora fulva TaxID=5499 RepID=A0A9Q8P5U7_PASFU|nr:Major facilitator-type transporter [Fulvia fulva]UJO14324.1 Major facilitator-type transporter [Fulvia fulva]WPV11092.1 Major facilitator-type transporter [Fulvia fulva]
MDFERITMPNGADRSGVGPTKIYASATGTENLSDSVDHNVAQQRAVWDQSAVDPVLAKKMDMVNAAIEEIGMTKWHWKLFFLNGFGYAVDSLLIVIQSITQPVITREYGNPHPPLAGISFASQIGMLVGAAAWGLTADVIGRKLAFNSSLFICAGFVLVAGAMPSYISFASMVAFYSAAAGGGYIIDATNLHEFLPRSHQWMVTFMSVWVPIGYAVTGLLAWAFLSNFSCAPDATPATCQRADNWGWRYLHFTCGGLVFLLSLTRIFVIKMEQTPRWLISQNRDEEVYAQLSALAIKYDRPFVLKHGALQEQGQVLHSEKSVWSSLRLKKHFAGLFETKLLTYSTLMIFANWFVVGTVSPLYQVFLPYYLESRGVATGQQSSDYITWRNYAINQVATLAGPCIAAVLVEVPHIGRKGTLAIGATATMALQFGYTQIKTPAQNLGVSCAVSAAQMIYYGVIYAYTPEILPSAHRATGYGCCVILNRIGGIVGVAVGSYADVQTTTPLFVCAGLFGLLIVLSLALPFESRGRGSV